MGLRVAPSVKWIVGPVQFVVALGVLVEVMVEVREYLVVKIESYLGRIVV